MAEGATVANAFVQVMPSMEGATDNITTAILPGVTQAGSKSGLAFGNMFTGKLGGLLKGFGATMLGYLAFDALADSFVEVETGFNNVIKATGATGEAAEQLKSVYLDVAGSVSGSFEEIGSAVGALNTRLGLEGEELEAASVAMMKYSKVTGQDAVKATQDVASMMRNVGIPTEELTVTLDKLTRAGQAAGIDVSSLANNVTKYNAVMKELGLTTDEQIALMAQFELSGADTASILNAMKKGVAGWAKEGKNAREEFNKFVQGVQDGSITAGDAVEIFGTKGGLSMYEAARKGQLSFDDMYDTIVNDSEGALDSVYKSTLTAQEKFDILGKKVQTGFYEIVEPIVDAIEPYMDDIIDAIAGGIEWIVNDLVPKIKVIADVLSEVIGFVKDLITNFDNAGETIGGFCETVHGFFSDFETNTSETFTNIHDTISQNLEDALMGGMELSREFEKNVSNFFDTMAKNAKKTFEDMRQNIENIMSSARDFAVGAADRIAQALGFPGLESMVSSVFSTIESFIKDPIGRARDFVMGIPDQIVGFFSGLGQRITNAIGSIYFPSPHVYWDSLNIGGVVSVPLPTVEWYGRGGFTDDSTLIGVGERGGELVWPAYEPYLSKYADAIAEHMPNKGVDIHDCTFNVRKESDIRAVAYELNTLINRQTVGGIA